MGGFVKTPPHYIRHNETTAIPRNVVVVDTETKPVKLGGKYKEAHEFRVGAYLYARFERGKWFLEKDIFARPEIFWSRVSEIAESRRALYVFAHNWHFDFQVLKGFEYLPKEGWTLVKQVIDSNRFWQRWKKGRASIHLVDTTNYFRLSLAEIAKWYGEEKVHIEDWENVDDITLINRVMKDVEITWSLIRDLIDWWREGKYGRWALTAASLAWNAYRHKFMKHKILSHKNPELEDFERQCYYGGRVEVFKWGRIAGPIYHVDINSMYPTVMKYFKSPLRPRGKEKDPPVKTLGRLCRDYACFGFCYLNTNLEIYPKRIQGVGLTFPIGRFTTYLPPAELEEAIVRGHVVKCDVVYYYETDYIFSDYVDHFWELRKKYKEAGDRVKEQFAKLMLNSLYGKFAQHEKPMVTLGYEVYPRYEAMPLIDLRHDRIGTIYFAGNVVFAQYKEEKAWRNAAIYISAAITSFSRKILWTLIETAGLENVVYVDTDSLFVTQEGYIRLQPFIGNDLGQLKLEGIYDWVEVRAPKDYSTPSQTKIKGVSKSCIEVDNSKYICPQFLKIKSSLHHGLGGAVLVIEQEKVLTRMVKKRVLLEGGKTAPLVLNEF